MLRKGYYSGRLDFNYNTPLSKVRENLLLYSIEEEEVKHLSYLRTLVDAIVAGSIGKPEALRHAFDSYDSYRELALPYYAKKSTITNDSATDTFTKMRAIHEKNKLIFDALKQKRQENSKEEDGYIPELASP